MTERPVTATVVTAGADTSWTRIAGVCLLLALVTFLAYWPVTRHEFVSYDDSDYVTANPYVQTGLSAKGWAWVWHSEVARNWHPVTMLSHMLDCQLYGLKPAGHHLTNLLFHAANAILLFLLLTRLTGALWRSAFVGALFALHPLHVESVAWIAERKDVLSTFFFLLTVWAYASHAERSVLRSPSAHESRSTHHVSRITFQAARPSRSWPYYLLALLFFALGLMSKPMLVTVPFVLLLLDYWPLRRLEPGRGKIGMKSILPVLLDKVPFLAFTVASCVITFRVQKGGGAVLDLANSPLAGRVANAVMSYLRYLGKMVWPEGLAGLYLRKAPWPLWEVGLAALALLAVSFAAVRLARRHPWFPVGWFWYVGTLVPVIGLVQVGMQSMADRYTYIPLIGIFILTAWGGWELAGRWRIPRAALSVAAAVVLAACLFLTRQQVGSWRNSETLFRRMISAVPGNYMAHYNLGNLYSRQDKLEDAVKQYEAALGAEPNYAEAHNNLGAVLLRLRRYTEAIEQYTAAVRLKPEYLYCFNLANAFVDAGKPAEAIPFYQQALQLNPASAQAHNNLGLALQAQGKPDDAMLHFRAALQLQPDLEIAEHQLANRLADAGKLDEAILHYRAALRLDPNHAESYNGLGICYAMQGKYAEAERQFQEAVRLNPNHSGAQSNLGNALGAQNKLAEAIPHYQKALEIDSKDFQTHFNLGISLLRQGRSAEARGHFVEALRLHPDYPEAQKALATLPP